MKGTPMEPNFSEKIETILSLIRIESCKRALEHRLVALAEDFLLGEYNTTLVNLPDRSSVLEYRGQLSKRLEDLRK